MRCMLRHAAVPSTSVGRNFALSHFNHYEVRVNNTVEVVTKHRNGRCNIRVIKEIPRAITGIVVYTEEKLHEPMRAKTITRIVPPKQTNWRDVEVEYQRLWREACDEAWRLGSNVLLIIGSPYKLNQQAMRNVERRQSKTVVETTYVETHPALPPIDHEEWLEARELEAVRRDEISRKWSRSAKRALRVHQAYNGQRLNAQKPRNKRDRSSTHRVDY